MNKVILVGNIGKDAETVGKKTSFTLATNETWTKDGEKQEKTTWHNIVMWNAPEKLVPHLSKGKKILVQGSIDNYQYDKDDGTRGYGTAVVADFRDGIEFVGGGNSQGQSQGENTPPPADDDIPF